MKFSSIGSALCSTLLAAQTASAINLNVNDAASIKNAAATAAFKMMTFYTGNKTGGIPGLLPFTNEVPYYWWEAGAMFGALIDYWRYTGDTSYNSVVTEAMLFQVGDKDNYMPLNQSKSLGNDDQAFWGIAAMMAAETNFPNPPANQPQWLALAQAVFTSQAQRWDTSTCNGGLRWQIFSLNAGYNYKNTITQGCFFQLAARLARYTGNTTYSDWAEKSWAWSSAVGLISNKYEFFDGADDVGNCTGINPVQWTYNNGVHLLGAAMMYNITKSDVWKDRVQQTWDAASVFFTGTNKQVMYEVACEDIGTCNTDQKSFKAYLARWMTAAIKVAPFLAPSVKPFMITSANAAAQSCVGGTDGTTCGLKWTQAGWDGSTGVGEQMAAMEIFQSLLIDTVAAPYTNVSGGTSQGNYLAGTGADQNPVAPASAITTADRAGAGIITAIIITGLVGGAYWMIV